MNNLPQLLDVVALVEDLPEQKLVRGQVGTVVELFDSEHFEDQVAPGRCHPRAPTDPDVRTLAHPVPQVMGSLRDCRLNGKCERGPTDIAAGDD